MPQKPEICIRSPPFGAFCDHFGPLDGEGGGRVYGRQGSWVSHGKDWVGSLRDGFWFRFDEGLLKPPTSCYHSQPTKNEDDGLENQVSIIFHHPAEDAHD